VEIGSPTRAAAIRLRPDSERGLGLYAAQPPRLSTKTRDRSPIVKRDKRSQHQRSLPMATLSSSLTEQQDDCGAHAGDTRLGRMQDVRIFGRYPDADRRLLRRLSDEPKI
jgi:hypothetical protein